MKKIYLKYLIIIGFLLICGFSFSQVNKGGTILNATTGSAYQKIEKIVVSEVAVVGQPYAKALNLFTTGVYILRIRN